MITMINLLLCCCCSVHLTCEETNVNRNVVHSNHQPEHTNLYVVFIVDIRGFEFFCIHFIIAVKRLNYKHHHHQQQHNTQTSKTKGSRHPANVALTQSARHGQADSSSSSSPSFDSRSPSSSFTIFPSSTVCDMLTYSSYKYIGM